MYVSNLQLSSSKLGAHNGSLVYDLTWQGVTNLTRDGPDRTVGSTRTYSAATGGGTLTFTEKVHSFTIVHICVPRSDTFD